MKILVSDVEEAHANACKNKIEEECPTAEVIIRWDPHESLNNSVVYALSHDVDIISRSTTGLSDARNENEGDNAWAGLNPNSKIGLAVIGTDKINWRVGIVHALGSNSHIRDTDPSRLDIICAVSGGDGSGNCVASYGPGLEFFCDEETTQSYSTARIAGIIGQLMIDHPTWNFHDARQALRQTASFYNTGWVEDGGYGAVDKVSANTVENLALSSPTRKEITIIPISRKVQLNWKNQEQSAFSKTVIAKFNTEPNRDDIPTEEEIIYEGVGENYDYEYGSSFGTFWLVFFTQGSYSLIESFDKYQREFTSYENQRLLNGALQSPLIGGLS